MSEISYIFKTVVLSWWGVGAVAPQRDIWQCLKIFWVVTTEGGKVLLLSSREVRGQGCCLISYSPPTKNFLAPNSNSAVAEKPCSKSMSHKKLKGYINMYR